MNDQVNLYINGTIENDVRGAPFFSRRNNRLSSHGTVMHSLANTARHRNLGFHALGREL